MITPSGDLLWSGQQAAQVHRALSLGIRDLDALNGGVPADLVRLYGEISEAARLYRRSGSGLKATSDAGSGTNPVPNKGNPAGSAATDDRWLSIAEAAKLAGCSESYTRRLCRTRSVVAKRSAKGAWLVDRDSLVARCDDPDK